MGRYSDSLQDGRSVDHIPVWDEIFRTRPNRPCGYSVFYTMGSGSFRELKWPGRGVDHPSKLKKE
jgi:hypothetical protein